jgi:phospho-N-acetylmuramoyl-pentapeptide-transferase
MIYYDNNCIINPSLMINASLISYIVAENCNTLIISFFFAISMGSPMITFLKYWQKKGQPLSIYLPHHMNNFQKKGVPTLGGIIFLGSTFITILIKYIRCFTGLHTEDRSVLIGILGVMSAFALLGTYDDVMKLRRQINTGLSAKKKFCIQWLVSAIIMILSMHFLNAFYPNINIPWIGVIQVPDFIYVIWGSFIMVSSANAVNLTDGLDGLAAGCCGIASVTWGIIAYKIALCCQFTAGNAAYAEVLNACSTGCFAIAGGLLGFLVFNTYPARVFMGDMGSLALGGFLGWVAVLLKKEFLWIILGGIFVLETLSVILQIGVLKIKKYRLFLMAPIHHHFEKKGWQEPFIVTQFWIAGIILAIIALAFFEILE